MGKLWTSSSCCLLLDVSLPWWRWRRRRRHKTNGPSSSTQFPRQTSISLWFDVPFAGLVVGFDLFTLTFGRNLFSIADACSGEVWTSLVHNLEPKRREALRFPYFWCRISLSVCRKTTSPRLYFWTWTGSPFGGDVCYLRNDSFGCEWASVFASK